MRIIIMVCLIKTDKSFLNVFSYEKHCELIDKCVEEVKDELIIKPPIKFMGKVVHQQRDVGFFSDESIGYHYANQLAESKPLKPNLIEIMKIVNDQFKTEYNGILVNRYVGGDNYISDHSDNEKTLDESGVIAISVGAVRKFRIKEKGTNNKVLDVPTAPYSLIQMGGDFQKEFTHGIPVEKKVKDVRYSFTFRKHLV